MLYNFSDYFKLNIKGHSDIDFIDINLDTDIGLYLDPCLIEGSNDLFCKSCNDVINSFFNKIFECCQQHDLVKLHSLLEFGHEPNETKLGVSQKQSRGNGSSAELLFQIFKTVSDKNLVSTGLIIKPMDMCLFVKDFAEDRMSDLITNILRKKLYEFTVNQCNIHDIPLNSSAKKIGSYWDLVSESWQELIGNPLSVDEMNILLVPKNIVRHYYFYSVDHYIWHQILTRRKKYHRDNLTSLVEKRYDKNHKIHYLSPTKKTIYHVEVKGTQHKIFAERYTNLNPDALKDFRESMSKKLISNDYILSDFELDKIVYRKKSFSA